MPVTRAVGPPASRRNTGSRSPTNGSGLAACWAWADPMKAQTLSNAANQFRYGFMDIMLSEWRNYGTKATSNLTQAVFLSRRIQDWRSPPIIQYPLSSARADT